jgi:ribonuclease HI
VRRLRKQQRAAELEGIFDTLSADGYTLVFTDGSSAETEGVGPVAGYGIYAHPDISISAYVPVHFRQTNNTAELMAVVRALQILSFGKVAICTDSEYIFLGATGAARRWKLRGWTGSSGPVSNVPLWELLQDTLSAHTGSIKFIKVPSHVDILGNNEADRLAEQGRLSHPRCPVLKTPSRDFIMPTYTPPTKRQRRTTVAELDSIVQVLNFSPYKDSMGGSVV